MFILFRFQFWACSFVHSQNIRRELFCFGEKKKGCLYSIFLIDRTINSILCTYMIHLRISVAIKMNSSTNMANNSTLYSAHENRNREEKAKSHKTSTKCYSVPKILNSIIFSIYSMAFSFAFSISLPLAVLDLHFFYQLSLKSLVPFDFSADFHGAVAIFLFDFFSLPFFFFCFVLLSTKRIEKVHTSRWHLNLQILNTRHHRVFAFSEKACNVQTICEEKKEMEASLKMGTFE